METDLMHLEKTERRLPWQLGVGVALVAVFWPLNWLLPGLRTAYLFFPLWLGYVLAVDGLVWIKKGNSLLTRTRWGLPLLFVASSPVWWLFEVINHRTRNWEYVGSHHFTALEYYALCTLSFSTVMPAVFETAEWVRRWDWVENLRKGWGMKPSGWARTGMFFAGLAMAAMTYLWPRHCYPLVWVSLLFMLEPLNSALGRGYLMGYLEKGDWRPMISLAIGALICGFFWELWNFYSYPKWIYHTPGAEYAKVFEMPLAGYGGYIPFGLELFALKSFLTRKPEIRL
jgi:hypothetical protein